MFSAIISTVIDLISLNQIKIKVAPHTSAVTFPSRPQSGGGAVLVLQRGRGGRPAAERGSVRQSGVCGRGRRRGQEEEHVVPSPGEPHLSPLHAPLHCCDPTLLLHTCPSNIWPSLYHSLIIDLIPVSKKAVLTLCSASFLFWKVWKRADQKHGNVCLIWAAVQRNMGLMFSLHLVPPTQQLLTTISRVLS